MVFANLLYISLFSTAVHRTSSEFNLRDSSIPKGWVPAFAYFIAKPMASIFKSLMVTSTRRELCAKVEEIALSLGLNIFKEKSAQLVLHFSTSLDHDVDADVVAAAGCTLKNWI